MRSVKKIAGVGAVLTCPCHVMPLMLLFGGTAGSVWLSRHLPLLMIALGAVFLISLWLLLRSDPGSNGIISATPSRSDVNDVLRRS